MDQIIASKILLGAMVVDSHALKEFFEIERRHVEFTELIYYTSLVEAWAHHYDFFKSGISSVEASGAKAKRYYIKIFGVEVSQQEMDRLKPVIDSLYKEAEKNREIETKAEQEITTRNILNWSFDELFNEFRTHIELFREKKFPLHNGVIFPESDQTIAQAETIQKIRLRTEFNIWVQGQIGTNGNDVSDHEYLTKFNKYLNQKAFKEFIKALELKDQVAFSADHKEWLKDRKDETLQTLFDGDVNRIDIVKDALKALNITANASARVISGFIDGCKEANALPKHEPAVRLMRMIYKEIGKRIPKNIKKQSDQPNHFDTIKQTKAHFGIK